MNKKELIKKLEMIAQEDECPACGVDMRCPKCDVRIMGEQLWIPLSSAVELIEELFQDKEVKGYFCDEICEA